MALTLTPEQESRVRTIAKERNKPVENVLDDLLTVPAKQTEPVAEKWGARVLRELKEEDALGVFQDRPEDSVELARKFRLEAEQRGGR